MARDTRTVITAFLGVSGLSILTGAVAPASTLGRNGESYFNTATGDYYVKDTSLSDPWELKAILNTDGPPYVSAGALYPPPVAVDNGDGTITIPTSNYVLWDNPNFVGFPKKYVVPEATLIAPVGVSYIVCQYAAEAATYEITTDVSIITESEIVPVVTLTNDGQVLHPTPWDSLGTGLANKLHTWVTKTSRFTNESGNVLSIDGALHVGISEGIIWIGGATRIPTAAFDSAVATLDKTGPTLFYFWHKDGPLVTDWAFDFVQEYVNDSYNPQTGGLTALLPNKFVPLWVYRDLDAGPHAAYVLHDEFYNTLAEAQTSQPRNDLPPEFAVTGALIGRIVLEKDAVTGVVDSAFVTSFTGTAVTDHEFLAGLLGGAAGEHYHITQDEADAVTGANSPGAANVFATMADVGSGTGAGLTVFEVTPSQAQIDALQLTTQEGHPSSIKGPWMVDLNPDVVRPVIDSVNGGVLQNTITFSEYPASTPDSFNLYWSLTALQDIGSMTQIAGATSPYDHTGLTADIPVYYKVTQVEAAVESEPSLESSGTPVATAVPFTWDAANKGAAITLTVGDTVAAKATGGWQSAKATTSKSTLNRYFEIDGALGSGIKGVGIALMNATAPVSTFPGSDTNGIMYTPVDGNVYYNGVGTASGLAAGTGTDVLTCAWEASTGKVWFGINSAPDIEGTEHGTLSGTLFPSVGVLGGSPAPTATIKDTPDEWTYSAPAGYVAWGS